MCKDLVKLATLSRVLEEDDGEVEDLENERISELEEGMHRCAKTW